MSFTNSWVALSGPIVVMDNHYYNNIGNFHLSICIFHYRIYIVNNTARQILSGSFVLLSENTTLDIYIKEYSLHFIESNSDIQYEF